MAANRAVLQQVAQSMYTDAQEVEHLGTGGFASTFRVTDATGETFAMKVIDPDIAEVERVARELDALRRVEHPNVVRYLDHGTVDHDGESYSWLKMEYVAGRTLREVLTAGPAMDLATKLSLLSQAVDGAAAIWEVGTAHRDLTPNNLMVTGDGRLVIVDLGMARHIDDATLTVLPTPGTPGWMAPEQVGTNPSHGDWRSDQFVLGLVAFALILGRAAFDAPNMMALWVAPANNTVPNLKTSDPTLPEALSNLVARMVARQPHRRYLQPSVLVKAVAEAADLPEEPPTPLAGFFLAVGNYRGYCDETFLRRLGAEGIVVQMRARDSTLAVAQAGAAAGSAVVTDPMTHFARSPVEFQLQAYQERGYGGVQHEVCFPSDAERTAWCEQILNEQLEFSPTVVVAPYFFAADGEFDWIAETLLCAAAIRNAIATRVDSGVLANDLPVWTTVAVSSAWLAIENQRDQLLAAVTGEAIDVLHLLVATNQLAFAPLHIPQLFQGFADVFEVMEDADVPVIVGHRASSGLLLLALGAAGWTHGQESKLQNMAAPPQAEERGGPGLDRIYLPELLNSVSTIAHAQFAERLGDPWTLQTPSGLELMAQNPTLEDLTTEQRRLLLQHNVEAQRRQAGVLASLSADGRRAEMHTWVTAAKALWATLPTPPHPQDTGAFLDSWVEALG